MEAIKTCEASSLDSLLRTAENLRREIQQSVDDQKKLLKLVSKLKTHSNEEMFSYFSDHTLLASWNEKFSSINQLFGSILRSKGSEGGIIHQFSFCSNNYIDLERVRTSGIYPCCKSMFATWGWSRHWRARVRTLPTLIQSMQITSQNGYSDKTKADRFLASEKLYR